MIEETGKLVQVTKKKRTRARKINILRAKLNKVQSKQKEGREKLRAARGEVNQQKKRKTQLKKRFVDEVLAAKRLMPLNFSWRI